MDIGDSSGFLVRETWHHRVYFEFKHNDRWVKKNDTAIDSKGDSKSSFFNKLFIPFGTYELAVKPISFTRILINVMYLNLYAFNLANPHILIVCQVSCSV